MFKGVKINKSHNSDKVVFKIGKDRNFQEFLVPKGFKKFPEGDDTLTKKTFFHLYGSYRNYIEEQKLEFSRRVLSKNNISIEDTVDIAQTEYRFTNGATNTTLSFQKLIMFDSIIDAYDELQIFSLQEKISRTENIDYSKIHKYYDRATFLSNNVIYVDEMQLPKKIVKNASTELVEMFCYIYNEILNEMEREVSNEIIVSLANNFKEKRLFEDSSLFGEDTFEDTISILKEVLNEIDHQTVYKDFDYWHFYEAIEKFLFADNEGEWSIDNFSLIWERLCLHYQKTFHNHSTVLYDDFGKLKLENPLINKLDLNVFSISLNSIKVKRYLRPDLIIRKSFQKNGFNYLIVDFKYFNESRLQLVDEELNKAILKQFVYEYALQSNNKSYTLSEFWIPDIISEENTYYEKAKISPFFYKNYEINVMRYDILKLLKLYSEKDVE